MNAYGHLIADDTLRFERILPGPIERVWAYLVEPDKRRLWLAGGPMTLAAGGEVALRFHNAELSRDDDRAPEHYRAQENSGEVHGRILLCEPPHRLIFTWGDDPSGSGDAQSEVEIELTAEGECVGLVLTHRRLSTREQTSVAGGWLGGASGKGSRRRSNQRSIVCSRGMHGHCASVPARRIHA